MSWEQNHADDLEKNEEDPWKEDKGEELNFHYWCDLGVAEIKLEEIKKITQKLENKILMDQEYIRKLEKENEEYKKEIEFLKSKQ